MKIQCTTYETVSEENAIKSLPQDFLMGSGKKWDSWLMGMCSYMSFGSYVVQKYPQVLSPHNTLYSHMCCNAFALKRRLKVSFNRICVCNYISLCIISHFVHCNIELMTVLYSLQLRAKKGRTCIIQLFYTDSNVSLSSGRCFSEVTRRPWIQN